jgi:glyoxylase-like metal-dependent hydrolase (beta-lactamase superfamily II)
MAEMQRYGNNSNAYVIARAVAGGKHAIIDPGQVTNEVRQPCLQRLVDEMAKDGLRVEDTGLIINTHGHPDHCEASQAIKERSNARVTISKEEEQVMKMFSQMAQRSGAGESQQTEIDFYIQEGELKLNEGITLDILSTPGHSPGHIGIYWPASKVFFGGDLVFYGSTGRVDLPGGSGELLKQSIERVAKLDIEYLLTGHQYGAPGVIQGAEEVARNFDLIRRSVFPYL